MKKATLFATVLALALAASAQESHSVGANVILPNARHESANAVGVTTLPAANAQSVSADARPTAAVASSAIQVGATAPKQIGICPPIIVNGPTVGSPPCK